MAHDKAPTCVFLAKKISVRSKSGPNTGVLHIALESHEARYSPSLLRLLRACKLPPAAPPAPARPISQEEREGGVPAKPQLTEGGVGFKLADLVDTKPPLLRLLLHRWSWRWCKDNRATYLIFNY